MSTQGMLLDTNNFFLLLGWCTAALNSPVIPVNEHGALLE
jgi:hypothetical protein